MRFAKPAMFGLAIAAAMLTTGTAWAGATLTAAAISDGFTLSTFVDQIPNGGVGPVGIVNTTSGILVADYGSQNTKVFADTDGQHDGSVAPTQNWGGILPTGLASLNGHYYMTLQNTGQVVEVTSTGAFIRVVAGGLSAATGIVGNPANGHLYVSRPGAGPIYELDPTTGIGSDFHVAPSDVSVDGLTISSDGSTLYAAVCCSGSPFGQEVIGVSTLTHGVTFQSGIISGGVDGTALGTGSLAGNLFANLNNGTFVAIDMSTLAQTLLFTGGSRGDFVSVDTTTGSLLITQSDSILRLTAPNGGGFDGAGVPAPGTLALLGLGLIGLGKARKKSARR